jgi:hypothetical protein
LRGRSIPDTAKIDARRGKEAIFEAQDQNKPSSGDPSTLNSIEAARFYCCLGERRAALSEDISRLKIDFFRASV